MIERARFCLLAVLATMLTTAAWAAPLEVGLVPATTNPPNPQMGDHLEFVSTIRNAGDQPVDGLIAWISLVQVTPGQEQPVDLEDWSAHKAVARAHLGPGEQIEADWPMRLIQAGDYRVVISAVGRNLEGLTTSPFIGFSVRRKPVVESGRILPVAVGMPLLICGMLGWRHLRSR